MTEHGTFVINGVERVVVPQLARSFGIFFNIQESKGKRYFGAKIIPARGAWVEIESESDGAIYVRIDKKRKFPITSLLRGLGLSTDDHAKEFILTIFSKEKYDLSEVGRFKFNRRFGKSIGKADIEKRTVTADDIVTIARHIVTLNHTPKALPDDIDHLGSRRVRPVGEMM